MFLANQYTLAIFFLGFYTTEKQRSVIISKIYLHQNCGNNSALF